MKRTAFTGIKPTGQPHLGNLIGAIEPAIALAEDATVRAVYFIADVHALNTGIAPALLRRHSREVAASYLAFGLDATRAVLFRQSDVPEIFELASILSCVCGKGVANRAHAYKSAVAANRARGAAEDDGINMGLYTYPILMAADILAFDTDVVPIGADQSQHLEIARQLATALNARVGPVVAVPDAAVAIDAALVPGVDGRKMSKSYDNTVPLFCTSDQLRKRVMRVVTESRPAGDPVPTVGSVLYELAATVATEDQRAELTQRFADGAGYAELKQAVFELLEGRLAAPRARFQELIADPSLLDAVLDTGGACARDIASGVVSRVKRAAGLR